MTNNTIRHELLTAISLVLLDEEEAFHPRSYRHNHPWVVAGIDHTRHGLEVVVTSVAEVIFSLAEEIHNVRRELRNHCHYYRRRLLHHRHRPFHVWFFHWTALHGPFGHRSFWERELVHLSIDVGGSDDTST